MKENVKRADRRRKKEWKKKKELSCQKGWERRNVEAISSHIKLDCFCHFFFFSNPLSSFFGSFPLFFFLSLPLSLFSFFRLVIFFHPLSMTSIIQKWHVERGRGRAFIPILSKSDRKMGEKEERERKKKRERKSDDRKIITLSFPNYLLAFSFFSSSHRLSFFLLQEERGRERKRNWTCNLGYIHLFIKFFF